MTTIRAARTRDDIVPVVVSSRLFTPITGVFALVGVGFVPLDFAGIEMPVVVQVAPFAISVLLFGLPHGALDHLVPARLDPRISTARSITAVVALYGVLGGATALLWVTHPVVAFTAFIAVTWFHWGAGDLWLDRALHRVGPAPLDAVLTVAVRGGLPMLLPLIVRPEDYAGVLRSMTDLIDPAAGADAGVLAAAPLRIAAAVLLLGLVVAHLLHRHHLGSPLRAPLSEIAVLAVFFTTVPPVLAVGLYFTFWHAVRHIVRLELLEDGSRVALERGVLLGPFIRFLRTALPVTLCAIAVLVLTALVVCSAGLGTYLLLIAALTTPHTAVVAWMDHRSRIAGSTRSPQ